MKIRGHRIELEAIESNLSKQESILDAACIVDKNRDQIIAFAVPSNGSIPDTNRITKALAQILPSYV